MAEVPQIPSTDGEAPTPRWVYAVGVVLILGALAFVGMHFASGGLPQH